MTRTITALLLMVALSVPSYAHPQAAVVLIGDTIIDEIYAVSDDGVYKIRTPVQIIAGTKKRIAVLVGVPLNVQLTVWLLKSQDPSHPVSQGSATADSLPWSGPKTMSGTIRPAHVVRGSVESLNTLTAQRGLRGTTRTSPVCAADPEIEAALADIKAFVTSASPAWRDAVYWCLHAVRSHYPEDPMTIDRFEKALRTDEKTKAVFEDGTEGKRYALIGSLVAARAGRAVDISANDALEILRTDQALVPARDAALRVCADKGYLQESDWAHVVRLAQDGTSPLVYAANYACLKSADANRHAIVIQNLLEGTGEEHKAALEAKEKLDSNIGDETVRARVKSLSSRKELTFEELVVAQNSIEFYRRENRQDALVDILATGHPLIRLVAAEAAGAAITQNKKTGISVNPDLLRALADFQKSRVSRITQDNPSVFVLPGHGPGSKGP